MIKIFLFISLFTSITATSFAQLGKMQYLDAEEQFANGKYKDALELLDQSERSLGKSNPMIEHLRIMSRTELLKQDTAGNIDQLEPARKEVAAFLVKYDGDTRIEDKYREVYQASKTLASLPTKAELEKHKAQKAKIEEERKKLAELSILPNYRDGMTVDELKAAFGGFQGDYSVDTMRVLTFNTGEIISIMVSPKSGLSYGYTVLEGTNQDPACNEARAKYENKIATITEKLGVEPQRNEPGEPQTVKSRLAGVTLTLTKSTNVSTWRSGTKTIILQFSCVTQKKNTGGGIVLTSINTAFK